MSKQATLPQFDFNDSDVTPNVRLDSSGRARRQFRFWMDAAKPEEAAIGVKLEELGEKRKFATFMRDAIRLMLALMTGDLSVLMQLFPHVVESIKEQGRAEGRAEATESVAFTQFSAFITQAAEAAANKTAAAMEIKRELVMVEAERQPAPMPVSSGGLKPLGGIKPLAAALISPPSFDDDDDDMVLEVSKAENTGSDAGANLIKSLMALQTHKPK